MKDTVPIIKVHVKSMKEFVSVMNETVAKVKKKSTDRVTKQIKQKSRIN